MLGGLAAVPHGVPAGGSVGGALLHHPGALLHPAGCGCAHYAPHGGVLDAATASALSAHWAHMQPMLAPAPTHAAALAAVGAPAAAPAGTLLFAAGVMNVGPPVLRYWAALRGSYELVALSNFLQGAAFGVLGAWPAMLAALQWPEEKRTLVTAVASLSNYVGGAAGVTFMPAMADTASKLLEIFRWQSYISVLLFFLMFTWLWIPPSRAAGADGAAAEAHGGAPAGRLWL